MSDMLQGHLSAVLVHLGNISHRVGKATPPGEIRQRIEGNKELAAAYERFKSHLAANSVDLDKTPATLGAMLSFDPEAERFVGEFSQQANQFVSREYRAPFVVPE
ncbi:MAG: gfo/Idh/MocA family oxidoreductase, partial [Verrucomicrobia bacterium]|nr:gfo/Idh/MocA family oxidoreductase [Verrucomicrobiota bacterium]